MNFKKMIAVVLLATMTLSSALALQVSAAETYETRMARYENEEHSMSLDSYLRFYYDTTLPSHVTKAYGHSTYLGNPATPIASGSVYIVNELRATDTNRVTYTRKVMSGNFFMNSTQLLDEYSMQNNMMTFSSSTTISSMRNTCYLSEFDSTQAHTDVNACPLSSETEHVKLTVYK